MGVWVWLMGVLKKAVLLGFIYSVVNIVSAVVLNIPYVLIVPVIVHGTIDFVNLAIGFTTSFILFVALYSLLSRLFCK